MVTCPCPQVPHQDSESAGWFYQRHGSRHNAGRNHSRADFRSSCQACAAPAWVNTSSSITEYHLRYCDTNSVICFWVGQVRTGTAPPRVLFTKPLSRSGFRWRRRPAQSRPQLLQRTASMFGRRQTDKIRRGLRRRACCSYGLIVSKYLVQNRFQPA